VGSSRLIFEEKSKVESTSLTETFEEQCPIYMSYGMSYDEFWYGDAYRVVFYRKAYRLKLKQEDENNWLLGVYVYEAILDCSPVLHAFSKKGTKPLRYRDKPILMDKLEPHQKTEEEIAQEKENERLKAIIHFNNWFNATKKHFENQKKN
jgi:hypothetical protein